MASTSLAAATSTYYQQQYAAEKVSKPRGRPSSSRSSNGPSLLLKRSQSARRPHTADSTAMEPSSSSSSWVSKVISPTRSHFPPIPEHHHDQYHRVERKKSEHARRPSAQEVQERLRTIGLLPGQQGFGRQALQVQVHTESIRTRDYDYTPNQSVDGHGHARTDSLPSSSGDVSPQTPTSPEPGQYDHHVDWVDQDDFFLAPRAPPLTPVAKQAFSVPSVLPPPPPTPKGPPPSAFSTRPMRKSIIAKIASVPVEPSTPVPQRSAIASPPPQVLEELGLFSDDEGRGRKEGKEKDGRAWMKKVQARSRSLGREAATANGRRGASPSPAPPLPPPKSPRSRPAPPQISSPPPPAPTLFRRESSPLPHPLPAASVPTSPRVLYRVDFINHHHPNITSRPASVALSEVSVASSAMTAGGTKYNIKNKALRVINNTPPSDSSTSSLSSAGERFSGGGGFLNALLSPVMRPRSTLREREKRVALAPPAPKSPPPPPPPIMYSSFGVPGTANIIMPSPSPLVRPIVPLSLPPKRDSVPGLAPDVRKALDVLSEEDEDVWRSITARVIRGEDRDDDDDEIVMSLDALTRKAPPRIVAPVPVRPPQRIAIDQRRMLSSRRVL